MPVTISGAEGLQSFAGKELGATEVFRKDTGGQVTYAAVAARVRRVLTPVLVRDAPPEGPARWDA